MDSKIISELLKKIHFYYPVGMPHIYKEYEGYKLMNAIVEKKIDNIDNKTDNSWTNLVLAIEKEFSSYKIFDYSYFNFPSYYMKVELESANVNEVKLNRSIIINVSLLVDYFTIFMDDHYNFSNNYSGNSNFLINRVVYNKSSNKKIYIESIEFAKTIVNKYYPNHKYLNHKDLFQAKVGGSGAYGDMRDVTEAHSIYEYLFNNDLIKNPEILD